MSSWHDEFLGVTAKIGVEVSTLTAYCSRHPDLQAHALAIQISLMAIQQRVLDLKKRGED